MAINEEILESFLNNNISILDEIIGTDAAELTSLLNSATISGMKASDILNDITAASSRSTQATLLNTRLNTMSRVATNTMMKDAPADTKYVYVGPIDEKTRDICLQMASKGPITEKEITSAFGEKVLVDGGGYNCRHKWEIASDEGIKLFEGDQAQQVIQNKTLETTAITKTFDNTIDADYYVQNFASKTLTDSEKNIINSYTGNRYDVLNSELRAYNNLLLEKEKFPNMNIGELSKDILEDRNTLNKALDKLPNYRNNVYRGLKFDNTKDYNDFINSLEVGQTTSRATFTSTSVDREVALSFATADDYGALLKIKSKEGKWLNGLSDIVDEEEVLFKTDSLFEVKKIKTISVYDIREGGMVDMVEITMEEI